MPFKLILPDGLVVEVDTSVELQQAVQVLRPQPALVSLLQEGETIPLEASDLRRFMKGMPKKQRLMLACLANATGSVKDEELRAVIGAKDNAKLGGSMAAISKRAKAVGLTIDDIFDKEISKNSKGSHYSYTMTDAMRSVMRN